MSIYMACISRVSVNHSHSQIGRIFYSYSYTPVIFKFIFDTYMKCKY
jgi:hypothetical protein